MREILNKCRQSNSEKKLKSEIVRTLMILFFGFALGIFAKIIDNISINDGVLWQRLLGEIDLRNVLSRFSIWALFALGIAVYSKRAVRAGINVFSFFVGMLLGYYLITITVSGFFPKTYIIGWSIITLFTPIVGFFAWYSKGNGICSIICSAIILGFFFNQAFSFGFWYINISYYAELICLFFSIILLYNNKNQIAFSLLGALLIAPCIQVCLPYFWYIFK